MITVTETPLAGVVIVEPRVFEDQRGFFMESFNADDFAQAGLPTVFVQDNHSRSSRGVLRGLHYQYPGWQGKLVRVLAGEIFDVVVDIHQQSATFGQWFGITLSAVNHKQLYVPPGYAHGFCVLSEVSEMAYKCTALYQPAADACVLWNDPQIGIDWPIADPILSAKDTAAPRLAELPEFTV
ncbi:MAG: dTDP-4-dehydrorhamnose 3,5-epimerase [Arenicellales bacterium]|nr:dTDP-4-dehydrorhamnose 3,5-epimerase [Arenicellales bacterium]MDP6313810.1 dTDP-4-dehydrorhamnose 3,5-epimerase [Arenicellales bacterium]MDP7192453.1 dTDP-4-dehydrorhamnose 3,5-epimerase [Arenicellales bacterium]MDP7563792.1 dTDP-4-dehydrorhamnose 3,5-epimerase [Arenicellales bacterium]MEE1558204.1 dTDP-4-dehydrorhamnose 3,5-epimerase [Arenicellales bacterium]